MGYRASNEQKAVKTEIGNSKQVCEGEVWAGSSNSKYSIHMHLTYIPHQIFFRHKIRVIGIRSMGTIPHRRWVYCIDASATHEEGPLDPRHTLMSFDKLIPHPLVTNP